MFFKYREPPAFTPKDGDEVLALGSISVYEGKGYYQLIVEDMIQYGIGLQLTKLQEIKHKLDKEGLFLDSKKRQICKYPKTIGIVSGNDSAAYEDIVANITRRYPIATLYFFPAIVQGKQAPQEIVRALSLAYKYPLDTIIIGRGGGSEEDLSTFNDERVVRHIASSPIPTIGAIGHEINTTLADLVCDKRASTPTGAAELATRDKNDIKYEIHMLEKRLFEATSNRLNLLNVQFAHLKDKPFFIDPASLYQKSLSNLAISKEKITRVLLNQVTFVKDQIFRIRLNLVNPHNIIDSYRTQSNIILARCKSLLEYHYKNLETTILSLKKQLGSLSPYQVLDRGYSLITNNNGHLITDSDEVQIGEIITTTLKHGKISSIVKEKKE
jgi:exodeoxyribonuclease VII large subunit